MKATATFTRPANTTAYAVKDVISDSTEEPTLLEFKGMGYGARVLGGAIGFVHAKATTSQTTNTARLRLHLYHTDDVEAIDDNEPFTGPLGVDQGNYIGYIDFTAMSVAGTGADRAFSINNDPRLTFSSESGRRNLYGIVETFDVFTPASAQEFFFELVTEGY